MHDESAMLVRRLAERLLQQNLSICTAESCTGGLIAKSLTDIAGSSDWFERGFVTYSNAAKMELLQVESDSLQAYGAVSEPVAREMAVGALRNSHADIAVAVTGIAGPGGGSVEKPVGTVWFGFAVVGHQVNTEKQVFAGNREQVREASVCFTLQRVIQLLQ